MRFAGFNAKGEEGRYCYLSTIEEYFSFYLRKNTFSSLAKNLDITFEDIRKI